jgi:dihydrofolate reductase
MEAVARIGNACHRDTPLATEKGWQYPACDPLDWPHPGGDVSVRKLVLQEFISLDGLVAGPNDSVDFIPASTQGDATFGREQVALMDTVDTLMLGRRTYEMFAGFWPNVTSGPEKEFADKWNALQKVVLSTSLQRAPWGSWGEGTVVHGDAAEEVAKMRQQPGRDILVSGSVSLAQALIRKNLIDVYRLVLCPTALGSGRKLFPDDGPRSMTLRSANMLDRGAVSLIYDRRDAGS